MSKLLEEALSKVRELPEAEQDEAAAMLMSVAAKKGAPIELDNETRAAVREGRDQARRGEFVSDQDMSAFFKWHGVNR
jgi:predicted transcriptional regulator